MLIALCSSTSFRCLLRITFYIEPIIDIDICYGHHEVYKLRLFGDKLGNFENCSDCLNIFLVLDAS